MSSQCYERGCRRRAVFTIEPVESFRVRVCQPCFSARYGVSAPWRLKGRPTPKPLAAIEVIELGESVKTLRPSGHGPSIPWSYRRVRG